MKRFLSTRYGFFLLSAIVCWALLPVIEREHRWVPLAVGGLYLVLSVLFLLEELSSSGQRKRVTD